MGNSPVSSEQNHSNIIQSIEPLTTTQIKKKISSIDLNTKNLKNSNQIYSIPKTKKQFSQKNYEYKKQQLLQENKNHKKNINYQEQLNYEHIRQHRGMMVFNLDQEQINKGDLIQKKSNNFQMKISDDSLLENQQNFDYAEPYLYKSEKAFFNKQSYNCFPFVTSSCCNKNVQNMDILSRNTRSQGSFLQRPTCNQSEGNYKRVQNFDQNQTDDKLEEKFTKIQHFYAKRRQSLLQQLCNLQEAEIQQIRQVYLAHADQLQQQMDISLSKKSKDNKFSYSINNISTLSLKTSLGAPKVQTKKLEKLFTGSDDDGMCNSENSSELSFCSFIENDDKPQDAISINLIEQQDLNNSLCKKPKKFYLNPILVNKWEKPFFGEDLNPSSLKQFADEYAEQCAFNLPAAKGSGWTNQLSTQGIQIWTSKNGSKFNADHPLIKVEYHFDFIDDPRVILAALLDFRPSWDKKQVLLEELEQFRTHCTLVHHQVNESILNQACREQLDKKIYFTNKQTDGDRNKPQNLKRHDDDIYLFCSQVPEDQFQFSSKYVRADAIIGINIIGRGQGILNNDVEMKGCFLHAVMQTDVKISPWLVKIGLSLIPKGMLEWHANLKNFLIENHTKLKTFVQEDQNFNYL